MNTEDRRIALTTKHNDLHEEVSDISNELRILKILLKNTYDEMEEIERELDDLEVGSIVRLAYAS